MGGGSGAKFMEGLGPGGPHIHACKCPRVLRTVHDICACLKVLAGAGEPKGLDLTCNSKRQSSKRVTVRSECIW